LARVLEERGGVRIVNGREIVVSPAPAERPSAVLRRRAGAIVVSRAPRSTPREPARDPKGLRGRLIDIVV
jgi:hypothetical protein